MGQIFVTLSQSHPSEEIEPKTHAVALMKAAAKILADDGMTKDQAVEWAGKAMAVVWEA